MVQFRHILNYELLSFETSSKKMLNSKQPSYPEFKALNSLNYDDLITSHTKILQEISLNSKKSQKLKYFFLWQKTNNFQIDKMSLSGNEVLQNGSQNTNMSKRQKKKLEQVLKQIAASENPESKSHKKRRNPTEKKADPQARKLIKTESHISQGKNHECSSSAQVQSEEEQKVQQKSIKRQIKDLHDVYNKKYGIPEESEGFSDYMVNYTYGEKCKTMEKQCEDWQALQNLSGKKIQVKSAQNDERKTRDINDKLTAQKDKVQELFSKNSKEFMKRVLEQIFPKK